MVLRDRRRATRCRVLRVEPRARQKGRNDLKLASLRRDGDLVDLARDVAFELVGDGSGLAAFPVLEAELRDLVDDDEAAYLFKS